MLFKKMEDDVCHDVQRFMGLFLRPIVSSSMGNVIAIAADLLPLSHESALTEFRSSKCAEKFLFPSHSVRMLKNNFNHIFADALLHS